MGEDKHIVMQVYLDKGKRLKQVDDTYSRIPFMKIGRNKTMNVAEVMIDMKPNEGAVMKMIIENMEYRTNIADLTHIELMHNPTDKVKFSRGLVKLKKNNIVKSLKRGSHAYIINPDFIVPNSEDLEKVVEKWGSK